MRRGWWAIGALVLVQAALVGVWLLVERSREAADLGAVVDAPAPDLRLLSPDGRARALGEIDGPILLHFWATWCPPCREELPDLLEYADAAGLTVLAVSLDPGWEAVRDFLGGALHPAVVRAESAAATAAYDLRVLPVTFVVRDGRQRRRMEGARDWGRGALRRGVEAAGAAR